MNLQTYVSFLEQNCGRVFCFKSVPFYEYRKGFVWSVPQFNSCDLRKEELQNLVWRKAVGITYTSQTYGCKPVEFWIRTTPYDIASVHPKKRTQIRRGIERCKLELADWGLIKTEGLAMNRESLKRQGRKSGRLDNYKWWNQYCNISEKFEDVLAWCAFVENNVANYEYVIIHDDIIIDGVKSRVGNLVHTGSFSKYLARNSELGKYFPNEALIYYVTRSLFKDYKCDYVIAGLRSFDSGLERWKGHMGFELKTLQQNTLSNPLLKFVKPFVPKLRKFMKE